MRVAICDDEAIYREETKKGIRECKGDIEIVEFTDGCELVQSGEQFDLIFLDVEMPEMDGMTTAKKLREKKVTAELVFLTSHEEFVFDAFEVRALRYLRKPLKTDELHQVLRTVEQELVQADMLLITQKGKLWEIPLRTVLYLEAYGDGTYLYDIFGNVYDSSEQLKVWESKLQDRYFYRIHKSFLVALAHVSGMENDTVMLGENRIPLKIARRNVGEFRRVYWDYIDKHARIV